MKKERKRVTFVMDKDLHTLFKSKCAVENVSMTDVIVQGIKNYLEDDIKSSQKDCDFDMTVTDSMSVDLINQEDKSWIRKRLGF